MKYKKLILRVFIIVMVIVTVLSIKTALASSQETQEVINYSQSVEVTNTKDLPIKEYAEYRINMIFGPGQWESFDELVMRESSWRHTAQNPNSTAFGFGQFLNSTWSTVGCVKTNDQYTQIDCMIEYVKLRYKTPEKALGFHLLKNWY